MADIYRSENGKNQILERYNEILDMWPVENKKYHVETQYGSTFVIESGLRSNPPLLLFHGSVSNSFAWFGDVKKLSENFNVFAVDIIGEAGFSAPERPDYKSSAYGKWIKDLVRGLGLEKVSLAGMSLGGWMSLDFAVQNPDMVDTLILLCPGGLAKVRTDFIFKVIFYAFCGKWGKKEIIKLINGGNLPDVSEEGLEFAFSFTTLIGDNFKPRKDPLPVFNGELSSLKMPVFMIIGENDYLIDVEKSIENLKKFVPHSKIELLPGTGHVVVNQTDKIIDFLSGRDSVSN